MGILADYAFTTMLMLMCRFASPLLFVLVPFRPWLWPRPSLSCLSPIPLHRWPSLPSALVSCHPCSRQSPLPPESPSPAGLALRPSLFRATPACCMLDDELFNYCKAKKTETRVLATHLPLPHGSLPRLIPFTSFLPLPARLLAMSSSSPPRSPPFVSSSQLFPVMSQTMVSFFIPTQI